MSDPGSVVAADPVLRPGDDPSAPGSAGLAGRLVELFGPASVLEVGGGAGRLVADLRERGVEAEGLDRSGGATGDVDPAEPFGRRYDLIVALRLEGPDSSAAVAANLAAATDRLLVPSRPELAARFAEHGLVRRFDLDPAPGLVVLERREVSPGQLVLEYETALLGRAGGRVVDGGVDGADRGSDAARLRADVDDATARLGELEPLRAAVLAERARAEAAERQLAAALVQARTAQDKYARLAGSSRVRVANAAASRLAKVRRSRLGKAIARRLR